jgi:hypothetical protein
MAVFSLLITPVATPVMCSTWYFPAMAEKSEMALIARFIAFAVITPEPLY